ncbi:NAD(P)H-dependent oxidoreductase [Verrucomicrobiaceae bacterium R5-34]|nr:NAD(P)H-dependent oxidoreductase [Verrucomicrobiaceae bacterium R5-34]
MTPQELIQSLNWRYATKEFDAEKKLPSDIWDTIEQSLVLTPSSFGLQPWKFLTVTDAHVRQELLTHSWNQHQVTDCSHMVVLCARSQVGDTEIDAWLDRLVEIRGVDRESLDGYAGMMRGFLGNMDEAQKLAWSKNQVYIALGQLMASAAALSVDACPMEGIIPAEYDRILNLEGSGYCTTVACALGYRSANDKYAEIPKVRFEKASVIDSI